MALIFQSRLQHQESTRGTTEVQALPQKSLPSAKPHFCTSLTGAPGTPWVYPRNKWSFSEEGLIEGLWPRDISGVCGTGPVKSIFSLLEQHGRVVCLVFVLAWNVPGSCWDFQGTQGASDPKAGLCSRAFPGQWGLFALTPSQDKEKKRNDISELKKSISTFQTSEANPNFEHLLGILQNPS